MTRRLLSCLVVAVAACTEPVPGTVEGFIVPDSVEIAAPGNGKVFLYLSDTVGVSVSSSGPITAQVEESGYIRKHVLLILDATTPGVGTVKVTSSSGIDSVRVVATSVAFKSLSVANGFACGLAMDDRAWCWGANGSAQIGAETPYPCEGAECEYRDGGSASLPLPVKKGLAFTVLSTSGLRCSIGASSALLLGGCGISCGIDVQKDAWCWGGNPAGSVIQPVRVGPDRKMATISTSANRSLGYALDVSVCGLTPEGGAYCLDPSGSTRVGGTMTFTNLSVAKRHTCGISAGDVYCWGKNAHGELGIGTSDLLEHPDPERAVASTKFVAVSAGSSLTCAMSVSKQVYCWGLHSPAPKPIVGAGAYEAFSMSSEVLAMCAATSAGAVDCWTDFNQAPTTVQSPVALGRISVGGNIQTMSRPIEAPHGCGLTASNETWCWGFDFVAKKFGSP